VSGPRPLVLVGAGGHGRETLDAVEAINAGSSTWTVVGTVADMADDGLLDRRHLTLLAPSDRLVDVLDEHGAHYHLAIGSSGARARLDEAVVAAGLGHRAATIIHPGAHTGSDLRLGPGVYLAPGACVTTNVTLGRHTHLNVNAVVSHDCVVGDHVTLSPGVLLNGNVTIGDRAFFGTGAIVLPGRTVGADAVIGAGAVVTHDVPAQARAMGVPARWT
jgi:sugar O-acyltransferase (sialic acid O-acetyltransferase NeuD family)